MYTFRQLLKATALSLVFAPTVAFAQPAPTGSIIRALDPDWRPDVRVRRSNEDEIAEVKKLTADGELSAEDFGKVLESAGARVSPREMEIVRLALAGKVPGGPDFDVAEEVEDKAIDLLYEVNLFPDSLDLLEDNKTFAGTDLPRSVKEVMAIAKLNGAKAYDVNETNSDGELIYTHYPSLNPPTENMAFDYTEITPASLQADMDDLEDHLQIERTETIPWNGDTLTLGRYKTVTGGTGSISAAYDEAFHPVYTLPPHILTLLGYSPVMRIADVQNARASRSGNKWSSNVAIMADGTIHCLPAVRRHSSTKGLILTNPALARGQQLMWNGHIRVVRGKVTYIGTSGGIAKRAARGKDVIINPIPLLKAWGFDMSPNLNVVSEHGSARPALDEDRAIMFETETTN